MTIRTKRVYDPPAAEDGERVLVDRLWPRGLAKADAAIDLWLKEIAPSHELRRWFGHDHEKWGEFKSRYFRELEDHADLVRELANTARRKTVTLLYGAKETRYNNATALREYLAQPRSAKRSSASE